MWRSRYIELESYYKNLEASVDIARKNSPGLSFLTHNAKATSVCDDIDEADVAADDNAKATSVHDDVGVPDAATDDNATSVCDDIDEADTATDDNAKATSVHDDVGVPDAAADDNAKAMSVHDNVGVPDAVTDDNAKVPISDVYNTPVDNENVLMKDAHEIINHTDPPIHGFQIMLWGGLEKKGDGLDEAKANQKDTEPEVTVVKKTRKKRMSKRQRELPTSTRRRSKRHIQEVVSAADNGEVVKETQLPDSHEDVFQPRASKRMKKETLLSDCPPVIGNYLKEIHIARWEEFISTMKSKSKRVSECAFLETLWSMIMRLSTVRLSLNLDQLQRQLVKDEFQEDKSMAAFWVINNQFQKFIDWQDFMDYDSQMTEKFFAEYTRIKVTQFRETLLQHMGNVKKYVAERARHQRQYERRVNNRQMQTQESKIDSGSALDVVSSQALDADLVVMESNGTESGMHDTSSSSGNYITHVVDANIRPINNQVPFAEVQLTAQHNVLANEQQHTDQSEPIYDTYLLEKVDSNTSPGSTNMSHRGGEIDQDAEHDQVKNPLLKAEFLKTKDMVEKEVYNELSNRFLQLEKHCFSLEISIQQKEESFQTNKPCKNQDSPEFREFFEINELKAQLQAKNSTINNLKKQIKHVHVKSNEAKVKHDIDVLETINIELESSVAKLLAENEKLNKENEHLKQTYKELYDSIKMTRIQTKDHNNSLIAQVNSKTVENVDLKAQIQEKFAKPSILGKPVLQPHRNQSVVRQPTAFKSERCKFSKPQFASQVDVINDLSKPVTPHYVPNVRKSVFVKPHHVIASGSSRNSSNELYRSNDMTHKYYLEVAKKKTQDKNMNLKPSVRHTTSLQTTTNGSKPKPRSNNQTSRSLPVPKSSCSMSNGVPLVAHSRNSSSFSDSKHFICSTCQKCVFNANHDDCITKFLKKVNSHAKVQSLKTRNINKPVEPKSHTQKSGRQIAIGQRFSLNKSSIVREKPNTTRSCLRWIPTGRIFKTAGLRWIPTGKMFTDSTTKVDSEPSNGSNEDITNL
ncbi:hypothetical protein Tco_1418674 [Tanacetum coccineum]